MITTCGRAQYGLAWQAGHVRELEKFGVRCSIEDPAIPQKKKNTHTIMTDSGKYIHYGPALTGRQLAFGSLEMCIDAACTGKSTSEPPAWLLEARVYLVIHGRWFVTDEFIDPCSPTRGWARSPSNELTQKQNPSIKTLGYWRVPFQSRIGFEVWYSLESHPRTQSRDLAFESLFVPRPS